ncbi:alpha-ketoglutarate-dependent dioxygenase alkB homolog 6 [Malaya genurostris]|uniref:alpha-ketoglutarate-dependent dioxygenase alkB homolog 6 n=1 Tax=Malaya genurostris TaxID=325434 RepID=UPI0026F3BCFF|nr:alpha-ketoglutarate-dependent dioxygenase alkB homolog 6 [Malaya genurostris]
MNLQNFQVSQCPPSVYYVPNFITVEEESYILSTVGKTPKPRWTQLSHRRLINYGGVPHPKGMIAEEIPPWLQKYVDKINQLDCVFENERKANHVLINEYLPGQGIMPHLDGPLFYPIITTISCGSHTVIEFQEPLNRDNSCDSEKQPKLFKLWVEPRSLLILKDEMYHQYLHSIAELAEDIIDENLANFSTLNSKGSVLQTGNKQVRNKRISLTIRHVPKTSKMKIKLF